MPLVLAGGKGWLMDDFGKYLAQLRIYRSTSSLQATFQTTNWIWLYRNCYANSLSVAIRGALIAGTGGHDVRRSRTVSSNTTSMLEVTRRRGHPSHAARSGSLDPGPPCSRPRIGSTKEAALSSAARAQAKRFLCGATAPGRCFPYTKKPCTAEAANGPPAELRSPPVNPPSLEPARRCR